MITTQELYLDISRETSCKTIYAKQYDKDSRFLKIYIMDHGKPYQLTEEASISLNVKRGDGQKGSRPGNRSENGTAMILLPAWMLKVPGECVCDISILTGEEKISTQSFKVLVQEAPSDGSAIIEDEKTDIKIYVTQEELKELKAIVDNYDNLIESLQTEVASTTTLEPGSPAVATSVYDKENEKIIFNFGIPKGDQGEPGRDGVNGKDGVDGKNGVDGVGVTTANINAQGKLILMLSNGMNIDCGVAKGADGQDGKDGSNGVNGSNGEDGIGVKNVSINSNGELVIEFTNGVGSNLGKVVGENGKDGIDGINGQNGKDGADGINGETPYIQDGYWYIGGVNMGVKAEGVDGTNGKDGNQGEKGEDGHTPIISIEGGYWYIDGINTNQVAQGEQGSQGEKGENGQDGAPGKDGANGQDGQDGAPGKDGHTPIITIKDGYWYVDGVNTNQAAQGEQGAQGEKGQDGSPGKDGSNGTDGKDGENGKDGEDGESAYKIWLELGNIGSESDFILWLKGEKGDPGEPGEKGKDGADGISIVRVEFDVDGNLKFTFSNGAVQIVQMPSNNDEDNTDESEDLEEKQDIHQDNIDDEIGHTLDSNFSSLYIYTSEIYEEAPVEVECSQILQLNTDGEWEYIDGNGNAIELVPFDHPAYDANMPDTITKIVYLNLPSGDYSGLNIGEANTLFVLPPNAQTLGYHSFKYYFGMAICYNMSEYSMSFDSLIQHPEWISNGTGTINVHMEIVIYSSQGVFQESIPFTIP